MEKSCGSFAIGISVIKLVCDCRHRRVRVNVAAEADHVHNSLHTYICTWVRQGIAESKWTAD